MNNIVIRQPSGYVVSGEVLFVILAGDDLDLPQVKEQALAKLQASEESFSTTMPETPPVSVKVLDFTGPSVKKVDPPAAPAADTHKQDEQSKEGAYPGAAVQVARQGLPAFFSSLAKSTPPAPKQKEDAPLATTNPYSGLTGGRKRSP